MPQKPPPERKNSAEESLNETLSPNDKFTRLASRLLKIPQAEFKEQENLYKNTKDELRRL